MPGSQLAGLKFYHLIAKLIFSVFHRRAQILANQASPAKRASLPHVVGPNFANAWKNLGWNLVYNELLIQPFCPEMERLVHIIVCVAYMHCCQGGCCYPCYKQEEILHEITISVPDIIDLTLIKFCTDMFEEDYHNH